jgi:integrase
MGSSSSREDVASWRVPPVSVPHAACRVLRRTTATYLHARGVPLATIQAILGHATIGVTMSYIDATALYTLELARAAMSDAFDDIRRAGSA